MTNKTFTTANSTEMNYWNKEYQQGHIYGDYPSETAIKAARVLVDRGLVGKKTRLLEIGGGYGRNSKFFADNLDVSATVIDISEKAIQLGNEFVQNKGLVKFVQGDARNLSGIFPSSEYDTVFHNFCLHLVSPENRDRIYSQASKVLKDNGIILGSYLSADDPDCPVDKRGIGGTFNVRGKSQHFFTEEEVRKELGKHFLIEILEKSSDPERIIDSTRNTHYFFVVGRKK